MPGAALIRALTPSNIFAGKNTRGSAKSTAVRSFCALHKIVQDNFNITIEFVTSR